MWDVGANVGIFAGPAAFLAGSQGHVVAFEPDASLASLPQRTAAGLPSADATITVIPLAVAEQTGLRRFQIASRSRSASHLDDYGSSQTGGVRMAYNVFSTALDQMHQWLPAPDLLKVDGEGAEVEVLEGARDLLRDYHPVIVCEMAAEHSPHITRLLSGMGYMLYDGETDPEGQKRLGTAPYITVAVHQTRDAG